MARLALYRSHAYHQRKRHNICNAWIFLVHREVDLRWHEIWPGCFPTNPDLANMLGDMDFDFEFFCLIPNFQIFRLLDFQKSGMGQAWVGPGLRQVGPPVSSVVHINFAAQWHVLVCGQEKHVLLACLLFLGKLSLLKLASAARAEFCVHAGNQGREKLFIHIKSHA